MDVAARSSKKKGSASPQRIGVRILRSLCVTAHGKTFERCLFRQPGYRPTVRGRRAAFEGGAPAVPVAPAGTLAATS
jgi:hypothetical protein